jgi:cephalosporin hydroxylase
MNDLEEYFVKNTGNEIFKWQHYFEIYDRHFSRFRGTAVNVVEFGVSEGGSLQMWKHYFGPAAGIFGIDINPQCKQFEADRIKIFIGDQEDRGFLQSIRAEVPRIDILIDDGGHTMKQQINTFEVLFPHVHQDGIYLCEDTLTSYWPSRTSGYKKKGSFIEYSKSFIDYINAWHSTQPRKLDVSEFTRTAKSLHFYDSVLVIEKGLREKPYTLKTGTPHLHTNH